MIWVNFVYSLIILLFPRKLKIYEEQELTMQVFNEPELGLVRRDSEDFLPVSIKYFHKKIRIEGI